METVWFVIVALATAAYAATDGFDLGIGILFPLLGRNDVERAAVRATISHLWRAYEVWLIVLGALLFLAFPRLYAVSFSGFYLAFMILLWCLIGRGLALEIRSHLGQPVWRTACDILFPIASFLIAFALGTAAGNVVRGVPLDERGLLFLPLWTNLSLRGGPAIFDWYTLITGALAVAAFALHGANYVALKTTDELRQRARRMALYSAVPTACLGLGELPPGSRDQSCAPDELRGAPGPVSGCRSDGRRFRRRRSPGDVRARSRGVWGLRPADRRGRGVDGRGSVPQPAAGQARSELQSDDLQRLGLPLWAESGPDLVRDRTGPDRHLHARHSPSFRRKGSTGKRGILITG